MAGARRALPRRQGRHGAALARRRGELGAAGTVPGEPYKFKALGPEALLLALSDGTVMETKDGGGTWKEVFRP